MAHLIVDSDEELFDDDLKTHLWVRLRNLIDFLIVFEDLKDGGHEVMQRILVKIVDGA